MNIFFLSKDPIEAARWHCDKHVIKMILETALMLSAAHNELDEPNPLLYGTTHKNHPCTKWVRTSRDNYEWAYSLFTELCNEYTKRYGKVHKSDTKLRKILKTPPKNIPNIGLTEFPKCVGEEHKISEDPIECYRYFYNKAKRKFAVWKDGNVPWWYE